MFLVSNGDLNVVSQMIVVESQAGVRDAIEELVSLGVSRDEIVVNTVNNDAIGAISLDRPQPQSSE
jgi:hypothetical protein